MNKTIVLQSDFGLVDGAVSAMEGVALSVCEDLKIHNLTHEITPYNIFEASYRLFQTIEYWPEGVVFVSVVDPGVGSKRKSVVARTIKNQYIVTPDNGTLTFIKKYIGIESIREIEESIHRRKNTEASYTFHGRDVYAYTAARLASGIIDYAGVGPEYDVKDIVVFPQPVSAIVDGIATGEITGAHDHFGNVGISIPNEMIHEIGINCGEFARVEFIKDGVTVFDKEMMFHHSFGWVEPGELILNECSNDFVEISVNQGSFCEREMPELLKAYDLSVYKVRISPVKKG